MADIGSEARLLSLGQSYTETLVRRNGASDNSEQFLSNYGSKFGETKLIIQKMCQILENLLCIQIRFDKYNMLSH